LAGWHYTQGVKTLRVKAERLAELSQLGASDPVKCFGISRG
jgi:hypothetical protein